jgi:DNA-binding transcriptional LysR family regulator
MSDRLQDLELFRLVVKTGSLTAAGRLLGLSPATMTARIQAMETFYGVKLLRRTTRNLSPTNEGQIRFEGAKRVLEEAEALDASIKQGSQDVRGSISLTAPTDLGRQYVAALVDEFIGFHPNIQVKLVLTDRVLDFVESGADVAIRYGNLPDSSLITRRLGRDRLIPCCSPAYAARRGIPEHPRELDAHNCLVFLRASSTSNVWHFSENGNPLTVPVYGDRQTNDGVTLRAWALQGIGIAMKSALEIVEDLRENRLVALLEPYTRETQGLHLLTESGRNLPQRVRVFIDFSVQYFKTLEISVSDFMPS